MSSGKYERTLDNQVGRYVRTPEQIERLRAQLAHNRAIRHAQALERHGMTEEEYQAAQARFPKQTGWSRERTLEAMHKYVTDWGTYPTPEMYGRWGLPGYKLIRRYWRNVAEFKDTYERTYGMPVRNPQTLPATADMPIGERLAWETRQQPTPAVIPCMRCGKSFKSHDRYSRRICGPCHHTRQSLVIDDGAWMNGTVIHEETIADVDWLPNAPFPHEMHVTLSVLQARENQKEKARVSAISPPQQKIHHA